MITKLDEHNLRLVPLKMMPKDSINTVVLNPIEDQYSLAVGLDSGSIELLKEQSNNCSHLCGQKNSVLSLAFSEQVQHTFSVDYDSLILFLCY